MDPQVPIEDQIPNSKSQITNDSRNITVISMAVFVLLALGAVGFLYYQNQQLKQMLATYQTPVVSPTPIATVDPTANWNTLKLLNNQVLIRYPNEIYLDKIGTDNFAIALPYKGADSMNLGGFRIDAKFSQQYSNFTQAIKATEIYFKPYSKFEKKTLPNGIVKMSGILDNEARIIALVDYKDQAIVFDYLQKREKISPEVFNQILSTFKFLEVPTPSPTSFPSSY